MQEVASFFVNLALNFDTGLCSRGEWAGCCHQSLHWSGDMKRPRGWSLWKHSVRLSDFAPQWITLTHAPASLKESGRRWTFFDGYLMFCFVFWSRRDKNSGTQISHRNGCWKSDCVILHQRPVWCFIKPLRSRIAACRFVGANATDKGESRSQLSRHTHSWGTDSFWAASANVWKAPNTSKWYRSGLVLLLQACTYKPCVLALCLQQTGARVGALALEKCIPASFLPSFLSFFRFSFFLSFFPPFFLSFFLSFCQSGGYILLIQSCVIINWSVDWLIDWLLCQKHKVHLSQTPSSLTTVCSLKLAPHIMHGSSWSFFCVLLYIALKKRHFMYVIISDVYV